MVRDDTSSVITVRTDASSKTSDLSQAKLNQLANARVRSLEVRRAKAKAKLEGKLAHLQSMLGPDLRPDTVERVAKEMISQEEMHFKEVMRLRDKHANSLQQLNDTIATCKDELRMLRKTVTASPNHTQLGQIPLKGASRKAGASETSSQVSLGSSVRRG